MSLQGSPIDPALSRSTPMWPLNPQPYARLAGALYLLVILFGGLSEGLVTSKLIVPGDFAATARNITGDASLWRLSVAGNLMVPLIAVPQLWIEYYLLRPVSRPLTVLFVLLNLVSLAIECVSKLFLLMVLPMLEAGSLGGASQPDQLRGLASFALTAHDISFNMALAFFGGAILVSGYLILRSGYFPRLIGLLMQLAGACYLVASLSALLAPGLANALTPWILLPVLVGEATFCLWLLIKGVNVLKWKERASVSQPA